MSIVLPRGKFQAGLISSWESSAIAQVHREQDPFELPNIQLSLSWSSSIVRSTKGRGSASLFRITHVHFVEQLSAP